MNNNIFFYEFHNNILYCYVIDIFCLSAVKFFSIVYFPGCIT